MLVFDQKITDSSLGRGRGVLLLVVSAFTTSFSYIRMAVHFPSRSFGVVFCQNQAENLELEPEEFSIYVNTV